VDRRSFIAASLAFPSTLTWAALPVGAGAETGPLTKIIFPFAAGGGGDTLCRLLAQQMSRLLDRTIIVDNLGEAAAKALSEPELREKLIALGLIPVGTNADSLKAELASNTAFWQPIVKATGYKVEN